MDKNNRYETYNPDIELTYATDDEPILTYGDEPSTPAEAPTRRSGMARKGERAASRVPKPCVRLPEGNPDIGRIILAP